MAAIISDKFRIFNASQFLESLSEAENTNMYFFVGRPQRWNAYLEYYDADGSFAAGSYVLIGGADWSSASFRGRVVQQTESALLLDDISPNQASAPAALGQVITGWTGQGAGGQSTTGSTAVSGVYRYATEDAPPFPIDNQNEKYDVYDDIIAAKKIGEDFARSVIRRYNWNTANNPFFDMWRPDYSDTPASGGRLGISTATNQTNIADAKYYLVNSQYEVWKCLYNGRDLDPAKGVTYQPDRSANGTGVGTYDSTTGIFTEDVTNGYIWKFMYFIPTTAVLRFYSTDFMPIALPERTVDVGGTPTVLPAEGDRNLVEAIATANPDAIDVVWVDNAGANIINANGTYFAPIVGDGTNGIVKLDITAGTITSAKVVNRGSGYTYASVPIATGDSGPTSDPYGLYTDAAAETGDWTDLNTPATVNANATGQITPILPPQGGHGANLEEELNAKRVMTNIRLEYAEGDGDFPVDNDFRRIGIIRDPLNYTGGARATASTLNGLFALKIDNASADYTVDELIEQALPGGGTAKGTVVSWTRDNNSETPGGSGLVKYFQSPELHTDSGVVRPFISNAAQNVVGDESGASGQVDVDWSTNLLGVTFPGSDGLATPEMKNNSGEIIYLENRRLITRAEDQIEDIKLVIEF